MSRKLQLSVNFEEFHVNYWVSHSRHSGVEIHGKQLALLCGLQTDLITPEDKELIVRHYYFDAQEIFRVMFFQAHLMCFFKLLFFFLTLRTAVSGLWYKDVRHVFFRDVFARSGRCASWVSSSVTSPSGSAAQPIPVKCVARS